VQLLFSLFFSPGSEWKTGCTTPSRLRSAEGGQKYSLPLILRASPEEGSMTPQFARTGNNNIDVELDQLTYSAYLLTLDPDLALSVVMAAVDTSTEDHTSRQNLLQRTIEISLAQLRLNGSEASDRQSLAIEALLYSDSSPARSTLTFSLREQMNGNPILLLDSGARIAFVLHHVLRYSINEAATMAQIREKEFRTQLRKAYVQLAALRLGAYAISGDMLGEIALA
jgi:hypothetical protein